MATLKNTVIHVGYTGKQYRLHINNVKKLKKWAKKRYWGGTQEVSFSVKNLRGPKRKDYTTTNRKEFLAQIKHFVRSVEKYGNDMPIIGGNRLDCTERIHQTAKGFRALFGRVDLGYYKEEHGPNGANEALDNYRKTEHQEFLNSFELES